MALSKVDVESGGTGLVAAGTSGNVLTSDGTDWTSAAGLPAAGSDGNVLTSDGTNWASEAPAAGGGGKVQQIVYNKYYNDNYTSSNIPWDGTIPQNNEGWEPDDMDVTITPTSASSILRIDVQLAGSLSADDPAVLIIALFQDSTANAIAATASGGNGIYSSTGPPTFLTISHPMVAGTTSATTFKVRMGASTGNAYIGRGHNGSNLGGPLCSSIIVTEYST